MDGTITNLIPDEGSMALFYGWVHDGKSLGYGSNKRDKRYMDIYEMEISDMSSKLIYQNVEGYDLNTISKDKNLLALSKTITRNEIDLYLFDRTDKSYTKINNSLSRNSAESFSLDGTSLFYSTDEGSKFLHLMTYDIATGKKKKL